MTTTTTKQLIAQKRQQIKQGAKPPKMTEQCKMSPLDAVTWQAALILEGRRGVITRSQTKLDKAQATETGYINRGLTLSSAFEAAEFIDELKAYNACPGATEACIAACVGSRTGQGALPSSKIARIGRTLAMRYDSERFTALLDCEIASEAMRAAVFGVKLAFRFNVATAHWKLADDCAERHPSVAFYDYSAIPNAVRSNSRVRRVYSRKDGKARHNQALAMLAGGYGVAVVFDVDARTKAPLPKTWHGFPVIDGDTNDLWFLRAPKSGAFVVGLRAKGTKAQKKQAVDSGFAVSFDSGERVSGN